ncbi:MAG: NADH-quinone oxidoreductase subunit NuoG [Armatimonadetes bacterium]|nr:NADH-quinone oxidoreductase subunit NuoG [Armatimonadota bacterium]MDW8029343.1 NADH-quinone oxidoreductase subunit NuoG [Armatimonadota bacterium]
MAGYILWDELVKAFWGRVPLEKEIPANILAGTTVGLRRREIKPEAKKVRLTIDGQNIEVPEGTLIIEAAKMLGIDIPHFCYHPRLEPVGVCRQCLVEVGTPKRNPDGTIATDEQGNPIIQWMPKPQPSCTMTVSDGMVVKVKSEAAESARRAVMEFLLINHPLDCPVCDRGGECPLQNAAFVQGRPYSRFIEQKRTFVKPIAISEHIALDRERCIMCKRCIRFCDEIVGEKQLEQVERGWWSYIAVAEGEELDNIFSGNVIDICPVGALTSLHYRFAARPWELKRTETVCPKCPIHCSIFADCRFNHPVRFVPAGENLKVNDLWICDIGRFEQKQPHIEHRLITPLMRVNGELQEVGWEKAFDTLADLLRTSHFAPRTEFVFLGNAAMTNEEAYLLQRFARSVVGSGSIDFFGRDPLVSELVRQGGKVGLGVDVYSLQKTDFALVLGCNIYRNLPIAWLWILQAVKKQNAKLVVAGVSEDKPRMKRWAWKWIEGLGTKEQGLGTGDQGLERFAQVLVEAIDGEVNEEAAKSLGVEPSEIAEIVQALKQSERPVVICASSEDPQPIKPETVLKLRQKIVKPNWDAVCYALRYANTRGCIEAGLTPDYLPGLRPANDEAMRLVLQRLWGNGTPPQKGYDAKGALEAAKEGKLQFAWVIDPSPIYELPDDVIDALANVPNLVVSASVRTKLAEKAWLVLPDLTFYEKNGSYTNWAGTVQTVRRAVEPLSGVRSLPKVLMALSERLGKPINYPTPKAVLNELENLQVLSGLKSK